MSTPGLIMWATVLLIGVPSAWRNPTAAALVGAWVFTKTIYLITGNGLAVEFFLYPDLFVLMIIFIKPRYKPCEDYWDLSVREQLKCIVTERTPADRLIMLIYPIEWVIYVSTLHPYYSWMSLWGLSIVQFLAAGAESLQTFLRARSVRRKLIAPDITMMLPASLQPAFARRPAEAVPPVLVACGVGGGG